MDISSLIALGVLMVLIIVGAVVFVWQHRTRLTQQGDDQPRKPPQSAAAAPSARPPARPPVADAADAHAPAADTGQIADSALVAAVLDLLARNQKVHAVKHYRDTTGVELVEAKEAVEAIAAHHGVPTGYHSAAAPGAPSTQLDAATEAEIYALLARKKKIQAVKLYRETTRVGLKEAKEAVDAMQAGMQ